jgi:HlyD family secretion protein
VAGNDATLFRKVALERLSTPDRLDQTLRLASSKAWLALLAMFVIIGAASVWARKGTIATTVSGQAVIVRTGGMITVNTQGTGGQVVALNVAIGDRVTARQVLARIAQPNLVEKIRAAEEALSEARREGVRAVAVRSQSAKLQVTAIEWQKINITREIDELNEMARLATEQISVEEQLRAEGLNTKRQVIEAKQKLTSIQADVSRRRAQLTQLDAQQYQTESEPEQVRADSQARITDLERRLAELNKEMSVAANVLSPFAGEVIEVKAQAGSFVGAGAPLVTIQPIGNDVEALVYIPAERAKEIAPGMEVRLSPTTMKREEFGHIKAKVRSVAEFPSSEAALMRSLQNETLVKALAPDGAVTEVRVELERDPSTPTGYKWSSSKGPRASISAGTLCTADVTTRQQTPLSLIFLMLRKKLEG